MFIAAFRGDGTVDEQSIFLTALEKDSPDQRSRWLADACGPDTELRLRIEALLARHDDAGSFLEKPPGELELENTLALAGSETRENFSGEDASVPLDFLHPSDVPGSLGRIGAYEVRSVLGHGGMGIVLEALDSRLNRTVAVKVLAPQLAANPTARTRFVREAQAAAAIAHPHVVTVHAVDEDRLPYLVMERVEGISLRTKIEQEGKLPAHEIARIGTQIAEALAAAHKRGLIHRDIKPANILLSVVSGPSSVNNNDIQRTTDHGPRTTVKVTDFGLARTADDIDLTQAGEIAGTPQYMSPEQARGDALDARSDLFSLGSVLYAMCTGRSPFRAERPIAVLRRVCDEQPQPIQELNPAIPDWLCDLINRLLEKAPAKRIQSAQEVATLLSSPHAPREVPQALRSASNPKSRFQNLKSIAIALAATFLFISFAIWVIIKDKDGKEVGRIQVPDGGSVTVETNQRAVGNALRGAASADPAAPTSPTAERDAFVLLAGPGIPERKFDTLLEAVQASSDGDTIEIRGNGPFVSDPITNNHALTIRAASGFRPVIRLSQAGAEEKKALMNPAAALVLEGLELFASGLKRRYEPALVTSRPPQAHVAIANCRLLVRDGSWMLNVPSTSPFRLINCEVLGGPSTIRIDSDGDERRLSVDNCVLGGTVIEIRTRPFAVSSAKLHVAHSTWANAPRDGQIGLILDMTVDRTAYERQRDDSRLPLEIDHSTTVSANAPRLFYFIRGPRFPASDVLSFLRHSMNWHGDHNVYQFTEGYLEDSVEWKPGPNLKRTLSEWGEFWGNEESASIEGTIRFQGGDVVAKTATAPETLTPDDFRLRPDSAGYRAGEGGKDLGADLDLVGPGAAYERFKKTPEYQQWLRDVSTSTK